MLYEVKVTIKILANNHGDAVHRIEYAVESAPGRRGHMDVFKVQTIDSVKELPRPTK